jgi:hypothetical protein
VPARALSRAARPPEPEPGPASLSRARPDGDGVMGMRDEG